MNQQGQTTALLRAYSEHPIAYYPVCAEISGSVTAGVLLSQILYWWYKMGEREFYKTDKEFADELSMGFYELRGAKKKLRDVGLISIQNKGLPRKTHYVVHEDILVALIASMRKNPTLGMDNTSDRDEEKPHANKQETTTKTTQETTKDIYLTDSLIDYLNEKSNSRFRHSSASRKPISARLAEGAIEEDVRLVIDYKCACWLGDPEWEGYLNPETLCRPTKFERNLNAAIKWHEDGRPPLNDKARQATNDEALRRWVEGDNDGKQASDSIIEQTV